MTWKETFHTPRMRWAIAFCLVSVLIMFFYIPYFYREIINPKEGFILNDSVLSILVPQNLSLPIFIILYLAVIQTVFSYWNEPQVFVLGAATYCAVNLVRAFTMYALTLEPPTGMILLADPISSVLYPDNGFAKDLFFSGHISTMVILVLIEKRRAAKFAKIAGATLMALFLAWQHVHYTIDLLAAPIITYWVFRPIENLLKGPKTGSNLTLSDNIPFEYPKSKRFNL